VGAYYHDIGKLIRPQYFMENQVTVDERSPHDDLLPEASARIIISHVPDGLALAAENQLPHVLRMFIAEHHGTSTLTHFLNKTWEHASGPLDAAAFNYPGPRPQTAETAIVMLADGIEASVRGLRDLTAQRIRQTVKQSVRQRMDEGQLVDAPLTLQQLERVQEEFVRVLLGMYHRRLAYAVTATTAPTGAATGSSPAA
jgi:putative nucleotidyltransferase with HDIG domain